MIQIRPAEKNDCTAMMQLIKELADYERAPNEVTVSVAHFIESGFGKHPVWWGLVAVANHTVVGMALYYVRYSTWKGQRMYLEDIIVSDAYRRKGIGKMLMNRLIEEAKQKSFSGISWQVLEWNRPAIEFYQQYDVRFDSEWINVSFDL